MIYLLN